MNTLISIFLTWIILIAFFSILSLLCFYFNNEDNQKTYMMIASVIFAAGTMMWFIYGIIELLIYIWR